MTVLICGSSGSLEVEPDQADCFMMRADPNRGRDDYSPNPSVEWVYAQGLFVPKAYAPSRIPPNQIDPNLRLPKPRPYSRGAVRYLGPKHK